MRSHHWEKVQVSCHNLLRCGIEGMCNLTGLLPLYPLESQFYYQMCTVPIPQVRDLNDLKRFLYANYKIEIPVIDWNNRHFLRLSVQGYNSVDDIDTLVKALIELLPTMRL